ncbi:AEC family transporter [Pseudomonas sp. NPDC007930]|uniref:AEC family transporter n=1 Tax=Pseudomonas sp. NPDC007930 TaxID=3364417 RepID=UPI0036E21A49
MLSLILTTILPIALIIAFGHACRRSGLIHEGFWPGAERLSYYVFLPSLFAYGLATADISQVPVADLARVLIAPTLLIALGLVLARPWVGGENAAFTSVFQGGIRFNNYVGVTAATSMFGSAGLALAAVANAAIVPTVNVLCVLAFALFSHRRPSLLGVLRGIVLNPLVVGCALGIALHLSGLHFPPGIGPVVKSFGEAALPLGLLCVGAALDFSSLRSAVRPVLVASLCKFLALPLATLGACLWWGVGGQVAAVAMLFQALPTASSSYVMARQMGGDAPLMATIIAAQTLLAIVVLPVVLAWGLG